MTPAKNTDHKSIYGSTKPSVNHDNEREKYTPYNLEFSYLIHLSPGGALGVSAAGYQWDTDIGAAWRDKPLYFKAGAYVQDNTGYTSEGGQVTFSKLDIDHDK